MRKKNKEEKLVLKKSGWRNVFLIFLISNTDTHIFNFLFKTLLVPIHVHGIKELWQHSNTQEFYANLCILKLEYISATFTGIEGSTL